MKLKIFVLALLLGIGDLFAQTFTYSGYVYNANGSGAVNVPVKLYKRTTPTLSGFTSQTNYNGHSYYRSTGSMTWTDAKTACENMGGHLATVSNLAENNFLFNTWPSGWIGYYQDRVAGYTYSEPNGGYRWTESKVTTNLQADYDVSSYVSGTTLSDITASPVHATLYNTPTYTSTGGKYLTFNGSTTYAITNNLSSKMGSTSAITLLAWVYPTGNGVIASELGVGSPSSGWHESVIEITGSNTLRVGFWNGIGITQLSTAITLNAWHLIAVTYDGTTMRGYLNNVNFGSISFGRQAAHLYGNGEHFALGLSDATNMGHGGYGAFRLGSFQVFNRALTIDELDRTYNLYAYRYKTNQYTNWNGGEPNNSGNEDYAQFVGGGKWNDLPNTSLPYVIEFDYVVTFTPWILHQTVYTNSSGYWSFSQSTNPATEWYIQVDAGNPTTLIQQSDLAAIGNVILGITIRKSLHWNMYDVNNDGRLTITDKYYISAKRQGRFNSWISTLPSALYTTAQYSALNSGTTNLKSTYPGVSSYTINSPISSGSLNLYLIAPGYAGQVNY
jgi:hypothetical protein